MHVIYLYLQESGKADEENAMEVAIKPSRVWQFCNLCRKVKPVGWLIIIGDAIHNFADGLALGASASVSISLAISTTIAEIFHEVPHELSEYIVVCSDAERFVNSSISACICLCTKGHAFFNAFQLCFSFTHLGCCSQI